MSVSPYQPDHLLDPLRRAVTVDDALNQAALSAIRDTAWAAYLARQNRVTITASSFAAGNSSGEIAGDPEVILALCHQIQQEIDGTTQPEGAVGVSFRTRTLST